MTRTIDGHARHRGASAPQSFRAAWPALLGLCLTQLVEMVDNSILNVAVPVIGRDLDASPTDLQWIVGAYSLAFGGLLMVGGTLGDKLGRRLTISWGLALFGLAGLALEHMPWQMLLVLNAPVALVAWLGVRLGLDRDRPEDLRGGAADVPGAVLSVAALGLLLYTFTAGVEFGWLDPRTLLVLAGGLLALGGFVRRERTAAAPMLDLPLFRIPTVRGSAVLQSAVMTAMAGVMFVSTQLYQFAWGWTPLQAGLANLPFVVGMIGAGPFADRAVAAWGHRRTSLYAVLVLLASLAVWIYAVGHTFFWCALGMLMMTVAMRAVMTTGAVALLGALPESHTSIGSALNDTAQELGNAVGLAVVGTVMASVVGTVLPAGAWNAATVSAFVHSQQISFALLAVLVVVLAALGIRTLTDSRETEGH